MQHIPAKLWVTIETTSQPQRADFQPALQKIKAACEANGYHFATYNVTMIQRDIPYETALAQCIESDDGGGGDLKHDNKAIIYGNGRRMPLSAVDILVDCGKRRK